MDRRSEIRRVIIELTDAAGYPPSVQEIADRVGVVKSAIVYQLARMKELGMINFIPGVSRTITIIENEKENTQ